MANSKLSIKKDDEVMVVAGKDRGKKGKVVKTFPSDSRVLVEGVNLRKRHVRARQAGQKGEAIMVPAPLHISNVRIICNSCSKLTRIGKNVDGDKKVRICKKCGSILK